MHTRSSNSTLPHLELRFRIDQSQEAVFHGSIYSPASGRPVEVSAGGLSHTVGVLATLICLLNYKRQLSKGRGLSTDRGTAVLEGQIARTFAQTVETMFKGDKDGSQYYRSIFGPDRRLLFKQGGSDPVIYLNGPHVPKGITVNIVDGMGSETRVIEVTDESSLGAITESLERQHKLMRDAKTHLIESESLGSKTLASTVQGNVRAERAWGSLEHYVRDLANPDTPWNRLYAIDRLNDTVWKSAETYTYFGLQAREYMRANFNSSRKKWSITFSKPVMAAIRHSIKVANEYLPNHKKEGHSLTAFDDWCDRPSSRTGNPKFEIVRILIWEQARLMTQEAYAVARLHKIYNIPLFYLPPSLVKDSPQEEYILFCKPEDTPDTPPNALRGMAWDATRGDWQLAADLSYHPLEHFLNLLENPKLVFAIDAREMMRRQVWDAFEAAVE